MYVFGIRFGLVGMFFSILFFIYMRLGGVIYGVSWLLWIGIFIKFYELCIRLFIILRFIFDLVRIFNCFLFDGMIYILVKLYMCFIYCRRSECIFGILKGLEIFVVYIWLSEFRIFVYRKGIVDMVFFE